MSEMNETVYDNKKSLPNKLLQEDGSITDLMGNPVGEAVDSYKNKPALPNKWLNSDGSYSTLAEILSGGVDTELFIVVEELPSSGETNKIYLVPDEKGGFTEYHWTGDKWDIIGAVDVDIPQQIFYWDGKKNEAGLNTLTQLYELNQKSDIIFMWNVYNLTTGAQCIAYLKKETLKINSQNSTIYGYFYNEGSSNGNLSYHSYYIKQALTFTYQDGKVTNVTDITSSQRRYLDTNTDYSTPYTPKYNGSPATKKYVDDSIASAITDAIGGAY